MKKRYIIGIIILVLIIIVAVSLFIYNRINLEGRKYEVEKISENEFEYFVLKQGDKYGVINKSGQTIINPEYDNVIIPNPKKGVFVAYTGKDTKILNQNGEQILTEYQQISPIGLKNIASSLMYEKGVLTYKQDDKMGVINLEGEKITDPIYQNIEGLPYKEGELLVKQDEKYGVINIRGKDLVKAEYGQITVDNYISNNSYKNAGYVVANKTDDGYRYGYVDKDGKMILKPEFNDLLRISEIVDDKNAYIIAAKNGQYGLYKNKEQIINNEYQSITYNTSDNTLTVEKSKKFGVATLEGNVIIPVEYVQIDSTGIYIYAENAEGKKDVFNKDGTKVDVDSNITILNTENENYKIKIDNSQGGMYSIIDKDNNQITKNNYSYLEYIGNDKFIASVQNGKLGVIDIAEKQIVETKYDSFEKLQKTSCFTSTLAENNSIQIYDKDMNKVCDMESANIEVEDNYIKVYNQNDTKYFSLEGKEEKNTEILGNNKIFASSKDGKWGFVDSSGNVVVDYIYEKVTDVNVYGFAGIKLDGKWGVVDQNGKVILEPKYEMYNQIEPDFINQYYKVEYNYGEFYYTDD